VVETRGLAGVDGERNGGARCDVRPDEGVFAAYVGLTASGYDLASFAAGEPMDGLVARIRAYSWPAELVTYFARARRTVRTVNPYWPRAFLLVAAALHLQATAGDVRQVADCVARLDIDSTEKGPDSLAWLAGLPDMLARMRVALAFPAWWEGYLRIVHPLLADYARAALRARHAIVRRTGVAATDLPPVVVVPNLLQAPEVVDFVVVNGIVHVIAALPAVASVAHELLHHLFRSTIDAAGAEIAEHAAAYGPVRDAMLRSGYAWGDDVASWRRAFEENLVRAATYWVVHGDSLPTREVEDDRAAGFAYVPALCERFVQGWRGPADIRTFIGECLDACAEQARSAGGG